MLRAAALYITLSLCCFSQAIANEKPLTPEEQQQLEARQKQDDARREAAIAEFTGKMKEANYPALFDAAALEFKVPADVLKGVAFAETRWEHLMWPPGETESPETGMPRPYGIMSLWDNKYFGHSLIEAANLIGKDPEELKRDPFQNMRGGAALLRKLYEKTPRPDTSDESQIESWRYAIRAYSGIPEPDLNAQHALDVFIFMNRGYHQYGIEWNARPVNLDPIRQETRQIVLEERKKRETLVAQTSNSSNRPPSGPLTNPASGMPVLAASTPKTSETSTPVAVATTGSLRDTQSRVRSGLWWLLPAIGVFAAIGFFLYRRRAKPSK